MAAFGNTVNSGFHKNREFLDEMTHYQLVKIDPASWSE
jgi:hypothetical protein